MPSVFELLDEIEKRPGMYVGLTAAERGAQLSSLEILLHGYGLAIQMHAIEDPGMSFTQAFGRYLFDRYGWSASCGPVAAVRANSHSDEEAWELFWKLLREYRSGSLEVPRAP